MKMNNLKLLIFLFLNNYNKERVAYNCKVHA
ncbi:hypothetical protein [Enterococcus phage vB_Efs6_KEN16]|uniref:Uncharacterized protein n=1 Tax=Enterococcus phage vB_Efs6_KEN16 TaxID=3138325 RepID=A0AAX4PT18_9CAUD